MRPPKDLQAQEAAGSTNRDEALSPLFADAPGLQRANYVITKGGRIELPPAALSTSGAQEDTSATLPHFLPCDLRYANQDWVLLGNLRLGSRKQKPQ